MSWAYNRYTSYFSANVTSQGVASYYVQNAAGHSVQNYTACDTDCAVAANGYYLSLNTTGAGLLILPTGEWLAINPAVRYYIGNPGDGLSNQASGAYIFRPTKVTETPLTSIVTSIEKL